MARCVKVLLAVVFIALATSAVLAVCVAPTAPPSGTAADYQRAVEAFVNGRCFLKEWKSDIGPHLSGSTVNGTTYSVHDQIKVYYSPAMLTWLQPNRPDGVMVPAQSTPIPDGAAMIAVVYPIGGLSSLAPTPTGYLVMIRQASKRPSDPASGWFFSQVVINPATYGGTRVTSSMGNYSLGLCVACHASAVNNLTFASFVSLVYALTDDPVYGYRGPLSTSGVESLRDGDFRQHRGAFRMEIGNDGWSWPLGDPYTTPGNLVNYGPNGDGNGIWGLQLAQMVNHTLTRQIRIGCLAEQLPNPQFRVTLSGELDALGIPLPQLTYGIDIYGQRSLSAAVAASVQIFKKMIKNPVVQYNYTEFLDANGTLLVDTFRTTDQGTPNIFIREGWAGAGHLMGTHRMGSDPKTSVVDATQKAHDHPNLYLLGSGNWSSYATGNPTLTISALALWAADTIKKQLGQ